MELKQLQTFQVVARELSFTRAAEILNYAQSSITAQIQALEEEFHTPLFERLGKRIILTEAGERLVYYADQLLQLANEALQIVPGSLEPAGVLQIGAPESLFTYRLPPILREFRRRYPKVQLRFYPGICPDLRRAVAKGELDVTLLLEKPVHMESLNVELLRIENTFVLAAPDHPLACSKHVLPTDLSGQSILVTEVGCSYRELFEQSLTKENVQPDTKLEFASVEAIKQCIMTGIGIAALPEITVQTEIQQGKLVPLHWSGNDLSVVTQIAWHKDKWLSPAMRAFIDLVREMLRRQTMQTIQSLEQFYTEIRNAKSSVMIFSADWCPDCRYLDGFIDEISKEYEQHFQFFKVDRDQFPELCDTYDILGIPSFIVFQEGTIKGRFISKNRKTRKEVEDFLNQVLQA
ncbi:LysR substrate-binding domain-containing protein [Fodinisporobacter ferrooxydans]|uniref:LysR substrate-binding domain-containing protein n=1 Tax=Fodinisporobacter ferrooxydans TaxID=2901836 RepID=A0ABY4CQ65_9BACL|nr:LysR substrate-binding domain-containing protein [Alicyclobacillaceae bacterium MYW30-H2]